MNKDTKSPAQIAYETYHAKDGAKPIPWSRVGNEAKTRWQSVVAAVTAEILPVPSWEAPVLDEDTLHYIACEVDHDLKWMGVELGEMRIRWNNRAIALLLSTIAHYRKK